MGQRCGSIFDTMAGSRASRHRLDLVRGECTVFGLGVTEISVIVGIIVLIIAVRRFPTLKEAFSKALQNFNRSVSGKDEIDVTPGPSTSTRAKP